VKGVGLGASSQVMSEDDEVLQRVVFSCLFNWTDPCSTKLMNESFK